MAPPPAARAAPRLDLLLPGAVALGVLTLQLVVAHRYGIFRDELYFLACGRHLQWGYVDQPPLVAVLARLGELISGGPSGSLTLLRLIHALCNAGLCWGTGRFAARLGGGPFAALLAALAAAAAPVYLVQGHFLSMNCVESLLWLAGAWLLAEALLRDDPRFLTGLGALCGLGLLNKFSIVFLAAACLGALLLVPQRRLLLTRQALAGAALGAVFAAPTAIWQLLHGLPQLELLRNGQLYKNAPITLLQFSTEQLLNEGPSTWLVASCGLVWLLRGRALPRLRALGFVFLLAYALIAGLHGKAYYIAPAFPPLIAAGTVQLEQWLRPLMARALALLLVSSQLALMAALALPLLEPETNVRLSQRLGVAPRHEERGSYNDLPQFLADQFGWPELAEDVAAVWARIPAGERAHAAIFGQNYGETAAIDWYGPALGLPAALSVHNEYWSWSKRRIEDGPEIVRAVVIGDDPRRLAELFEQVERAAIHRSKWAMPYETELPIWLCSGPRRPLREVWPGLHHYQ